MESGRDRTHGEDRLSSGSGRPPADVEIEILGPDRSLEDRLLAGGTRRHHHAAGSRRPSAGDPRIASLFPDPIAAEKAWFVAAKHFPIMHAVGIKKSFLVSDFEARTASV